MEAVASAAQYGIAAVTVVACSFALWTMYTAQTRERDRMLKSHADERSADEDRFQKERSSMAEMFARQHQEALEVTRQSVKVTTELITFLRAKIN
jgi:cytosine/adenosine deaminase-related metal-dependent hydrolase